VPKQPQTEWESGRRECLNHKIPAEDKDSLVHQRGSYNQLPGSTAGVGRGIEAGVSVPTTRLISGEESGVGVADDKVAEPWPTGDAGSGRVAKTG
jgi:hypothetical protein